MIGPAPLIHFSDKNAACQNIHGSLWRRLVALGERSSKEPPEILLHGPVGIGKTILLRQLYWEFFQSLDYCLPLYINIPALPFQPVQWVRQFLNEVARQWLSYRRRDPNLGLGTLQKGPLQSLCENENLYPLGDAMRQLDALSSDDPIALLQTAMEIVYATANHLEQPVMLIIDSVENAKWAEGENALYLSRVLSPVAERSWIRRIWATRANSDSLAFAGYAPIDAQPWEVAPIGHDASLEFFRNWARDLSIDYDADIIEQALSLWGGIPAWMANFARMAADSPLSLTSADSVVNIHLSDIQQGPTSRFLHSILFPSFGQSLEPRALAQFAESIGRNSLTSTTVAENPVAAGRLMDAGVTEYRDGQLRLSSHPVLSDFSELFISKHLHAADKPRMEISIKRKRLMETTHRVSVADDHRRLRNIEMILQAFKGQSVPKDLFHCAERTVRTDQTALPSMDFQDSPSMSIPHCIGAWIQPSGQHIASQAPSPAVVGWCFGESGFYRSDENLWIAYLCKASVVTSQELDVIARNNQRLMSETHVGRCMTWVIADGTFSVEASKRIAAEKWLASSWSDFEILAGLLLQSSRESVIPEATLSARAKVISAFRPDSSAKVVEVKIPPKPDMELLAAASLEQLATASGYAPETIAAMKMAVLEACLNAIEHSANPEKEIRVSMECTPTKFTILVENEGATFDPQEVEEPDIADKIGMSYKRGWGISLIRKLMDRVVFEPYDQGTRLRMEKNAQPGQSSEKQDTGMA